MALWQIQVEHNVRSGLTFKFRERLAQYLKQTHDADGSLPATIEELTRQAGIIPVVNGGPDGMRGNENAVPYRPALYVAGDIEAA